MKSFKDFLKEMSLPSIETAEDARQKILQIAPIVLKGGESKGDYIGTLWAALKAIQTSTNPEAYAKEVRMATAAVKKLKEHRATLSAAQTQHTTMKPTDSFGSKKTFESVEVLSKISSKWKINEAKADVLNPRMTDNPKTDATSTLRGGVKKTRGNFNKRVDTIGKENTKGNEVDMGRFQEILGHISGLAAFSKNIDNPTKIGGNEINEFVRSELAKLLIIKELKNPEKDIGVVVKALNIKRPEALRGALMKIGELFKDTISYMTPSGKEVKKIEALMEDFNLVKKDMNRLPAFLASARKNQVFSTILKQMSNEQRYRKWF